MNKLLMAPISKTHYNYLVIGGGSGGVASARRAAQYGASALVIEANRMGGTCVNVGCVPKKVMWYASDMANKIALAKDYGFDVDPSLSKTFKWSHFKEKRDAYVARLNGIYERNLTKEGVEYMYGFAHFNKEGKVDVFDKSDKSKLLGTFSADKILIATGGETIYPAKVPGFELGTDSDGFFALEKQPRRVAVVGAGYIGIELAGVFHGLNTETHLIIRGETVLRRFDDIIQTTITDHYVNEGISVHKHSNVVEVKKNADGSLKVIMDTATIEVDVLIWTIGRKSMLGIGLENVGVALSEKDHVITNEYQETTRDSILSIGDVTGQVELTPVAIATGRKLSDRLFGPYKDAKQDFSNIPSVVFSHPEAGSIGLSEKEAIEKYGSKNLKIYKSRFTSMYYAMSEHKIPTAYKLICAGQEEKVVGMHIVGDCSAEILQGFGVAIKMGATKADFDSCVAIHPTSAEELVTMK